MLSHLLSELFIFLNLKTILSFLATLSHNLEKTEKYCSEAVDLRLLTLEPRGFLTHERA